MQLQVAYEQYVELSVCLSVEKLCDFLTRYMLQILQKTTNFRVQMEIMISEKIPFDAIHQILEILTMSGVHFR